MLILCIICTLTNAKSLEWTCEFTNFSLLDKFILGKLKKDDICKILLYHPFYFLVDLAPNA